MSPDKIIDSLQDRLFDLYATFFKTSPDDGVQPNDTDTTKDSDVKKACRDLLRSTIEKLNLVSREEFDAQSQVLVRLQQQVHLLEAKVTLLEAQNAVAASASDKPVTPSKM